MVDLIARRPFMYAYRRIMRGQAFVASDADAKILELIGHAEPTPLAARPDVSAPDNRDYVNKDREAEAAPRRRPRRSRVVETVEG